MDPRQLLTANLAAEFGPRFHLASSPLVVATDADESASLSTSLSFAPGRKIDEEGVAATLTITNNGPLDATNLEVFVPSFAGGGLLELSGYAYTFGAQGATISIGTLAAGATEQVPLAVFPEGTNSITLTTIVSGPSATTSTASATTAIQGRSDLLPYGPRVLAAEREGVHHQPTTVLLTFDTAMDPTRAVNLANYSLRPVGFRGHLGHPVKLKSATYNPATLEVQITPRGRLNPRVAYQLVAVGSVATGLTDASGNLLDGMATGLTGSDYVTTLPRLA